MAAKRPNVPSDLAGRSRPYKPKKPRKIPAPFRFPLIGGLIWFVGLVIYHALFIGSPTAGNADDYRLRGLQESDGVD